MSVNPSTIKQVEEFLGRQEEYHKTKTLESELEVFDKIQLLDRSGNARRKTYQFTAKKVDYYFDADFSYLAKLIDKEHTVLVTDENIFRAQAKKFKGWKTIVLKPGEQAQSTGYSQYVL